MSPWRIAGIGLVVGAIGWVLLWFNTEPRSNFDSLIYHTRAFEYAGLSRQAADDLSWEVYARYADDRERTIITATIGGAWSTPNAPRWMGLYEMRPLYPTIVAAAYPMASWRAPMVTSAVVTVTFFVATVTGFWLLFGPRVALFATLAALVQANFTHWLVFLSTDGAAMAMWAVCLVATALFATRGQARWLAAVAVGALLLALARPTGSLAPFVPLVCAVAALVARRPVWRRFGLATVAAAVPAGLVLLWQHQVGYPGLSDVLQEIPTRHFGLPDIADPIGYSVSLAWWALTDRLLPTLLTDPFLLGAVIAGLVGFAIRPRWSTAPFLAGALLMPLAWIVHPVWYDAGRILAPVWVSLNLGIGLVIEWAVVRFREPIRDAAAWATSPEEQAA